MDNFSLVIISIELDCCDAN